LQILSSDAKSIALVLVTGLLLILCGTFGGLLFGRLRSGKHPAKLVVRNVSIGGVFGGYDFSDTLILFVCYVLTLLLLAGVCLPLRPDDKRSDRSDDAKGAAHMQDSAVCMQDQPASAVGSAPKAGGPATRSTKAPGAPTATSSPVEPRP
jgi:hypothetical protein